MNDDTDAIDAFAQSLAERVAARMFDADRASRALGMRMSA